MSTADIQNLLDLHGQTIAQDGGYWVKIEAWTVEVSSAIPHGIRYSLTLHNPDGERLLGYDNAHAAKVKGKKYSGQRLAYDHKHRHAVDTGVPYEFKDAGQLVVDFFTEVDLILEKEKTK